MGRSDGLTSFITFFSGRPVCYCLFSVLLSVSFPGILAEKGKETKDTKEKQ